MKSPASGSLRSKNSLAAKSQTGAGATPPLKVADPESEALLVLRGHRAKKVSRCHSTGRAVGVVLALLEALTASEQNS